MAWEESSSCRFQPSSNASGTWIFSLARHRGQDIQDDAACVEYPLPQ